MPVFAPQSLALLSAFLAPQATEPRDAVAEPDRPNLVIVFCDDIGYGDLGCYGNPVMRTPNLDRFAAEGMRFTSLYAGGPSCSPSRTALLTGRAPGRAGIHDILTPLAPSDMALPESELTLAELLHDSGYATYHLGKWHLTQQATEAEEAALEHGFERTLQGEHDATKLVETFAAWLEERTDDAPPFFAYLAFNECHEPVGDWSPQEYRDLYDGTERDAKKIVYRGRRQRAHWEERDIYFGCVSHMDAAFGEVLEALEREDLRESSVVLFASDNGPSRRSRNSWGSTGPLRGGKGSLYEGGIRVPGMIRWPGRIEPGQVTDEVVHVWDVLPTFCEIAAVDPPADRTLDGVSLADFLHGGELERTRPLYWGGFASTSGGHAALRDGPWKILAALEHLDPQRDVLDYVRNGAFSRYELYRVADDSLEKNELSAAEPEVFERMKAELLQLHREVVNEGPDFDLEGYRRRINRGRD